MQPSVLLRVLVVLLLWPAGGMARPTREPRPRSFPGPPLGLALQDQRELHLRQARQEEEQGLFEEAAEHYELAAQDQQPPEAAGLLLRAAALRLGLGQREAVLRDAERYQKQLHGKTPARTLAFALLLARHHADREEWSGTLSALKSVDPLLPQAPRAQRTEAHLLRLRALAGGGDLRRAEAEARRLLALSLHPEKPDDATQEALFFLAELEARRADQLQEPTFRGKPTRENIRRFHAAQVAPWYRRKLAATQQADRALQGLLARQLSPRWSTASAARMGELWARFTHQVRALPVALAEPSMHPVEDPPEQILKQRAREAFARCLQEAARRQHHDESVARCEAWIARHHPGEYPENEGYRRPPTASGALHEPRPRCAPEPAAGGASLRCGWSAERPHFSSHLWPQKRYM